MANSKKILEALKNVSQELIEMDSAQFELLFNNAEQGEFYQLLECAGYIDGNINDEIVDSIIRNFNYRISQNIYSSTIEQGWIDCSSVVCDEHSNDVGPSPEEELWIKVA